MKYILYRSFGDLDKMCIRDRYVTTGILEYSDSVMPTIWTFHHAHLLVDNGASRPADFLLHLR